MKRKIKQMVVLAAAVACPAIVGAATTGFNQTTAGPWDYNTTGNWVGGTINGIWDSSLTITAAQTVQFAADTSLGTGLTFNYVGNFGLTLDSSSATAHTITLAGDIAVAPNSNQTVTIGNATNVLNLDLGGVTRTLTVNGSKTLSLINVVSDGGINFTGGGTLTLGGNNTFAGGITMNQGLMNLNAASSYTGGTAVTGGTVAVNAAGTLGSNTSGNNVSITGAVLTLAASTNIGASQTLTIGSTSSVLGVLGVAFNGLPAFTQSGTGPTVFAINTTGYNAVTSEAALGTVFLGSTGSGTFAGTTLAANSDGIYRLGGGGGTLTVTNGVLAGANSLIVDSTLTNGGGTVVLQGANTLSGGTTVAAGTLKLAGANGSLASSDVTVNAATLTFDSSTAVAGTTRAKSVTLQDGIFSVAGNNTMNSADSATNTVTLDGSYAGYDIFNIANGTKNTQLSLPSITRTGGAVALFRGVNLGANPIASPTAGSGNIQIATAPTLIGGGGALGSVTQSIIPWAIGGTSTSDGGSTFVTYDAGNGIHPLLSSEFANSIADGSVTTNNVQLSGGGTLAAIPTGATINSLFILANAATQNITGGTLKITSGALYVGANGTTTISNNIDFGSAQGVIGYISGKVSAINGNISGTGGLVLYQNTQSGFGTGMNLSGTASTYTGNTYIYGRTGDVQVGVIPDFANGGRTGDLYVYGQLGVTAPTFGINGLFGTGSIVMGHSGTMVLAVGDDNSDGNFSGSISDNGTLTLNKIGSGTLVLTGSNDYAGATQITGGVLSTNLLGNGGVDTALGVSSSAATSLVINGGTLRYTGAAVNSDRLFQVGQTTNGGTATLDASGTGALVLTNTGNLTFGTAGATGSAQKRTLILTGSNTDANSLAAVIGNNGAATNGNSAVTVNKTGGGTWKLSATNTYAGGTNISGGTLAASGTLGSGAVNVTGGVLELDSNTAIADSAALTLTGSGTLDLEFATATNETVGSLTFGGVTYTSGTFAVGDPGTSGYFTGVAGAGITVAPEPTSLGFFALGGMTMLARRRRKNTDGR